MSIIKKIIGLQDLAQKIKKLKKQNKKIVHCHGVFDLVHPGHIKHFMSASKQGDVLVVTLTPDMYVNKGPGRPVFDQHLRAESIAALECVDFVAINMWPTATETIRLLKPHIYAKGAEYANPEKDLTGGIDDEKQAIESVEGQIFFTDEMTFSSSSLLNSFFNPFDEHTKTFLKLFGQKYDPEEIIRACQGVASMKILVIGDAIIDEYHYCKAIGKSPKENLISTRFISEERFAGGVLACANHLAGFCENIHLVTCLGGDDPKESFIRKHLKSNIDTKFFYDNKAGTTIKRRYVDPDFMTKSFEISFIDDKPILSELSNEICSYLNDVVPDYDMVLATDFGHGFMDAQIINTLCQKAKFLAVNTQTNSANAGYNLITKYPRADYICLDEPEIRLATHNKYGNLNDIICLIADKLNCSRVTVTRGHNGARTYDRDKGFFDSPVLTKKIVDRIGAGDAFLSVTSPIVCAGNSMQMVGFIGNAAGAIAVNIVGNRQSIEPSALFKFATALLK